MASHAYFEQQIWREIRVAGVTGLACAEVVLFAQPPVNVAGDARRQRPDGRPAAGEQHHHHQLAWPTSLKEPNQPRCVWFSLHVPVLPAMGPSSRARCAVPNSTAPRMPGFDHRNQAADIQAALDLRHEALRFLLGARILQIVQRAAVGDGAHQRRQLQRRLLDLLAEAGQHAHAAVARRRRGIMPGCSPGMFSPAFSP